MAVVAIEAQTLSGSAIRFKPTEHQVLHSLKRTFNRGVTDPLDRRGPSVGSEFKIIDPAGAARHGKPLAVGYPLMTISIVSGGTP